MSSPSAGALLLADLHSGFVSEDSSKSSGNDSESLFLSQSSLFKSYRSYNKWSPTEEGTTLAWKDLNIYIKKKGGRNYQRIINGISGAVKPGSLVALMGSSGAGKSTLMSALAYRNSEDVKVEGDVLINGRPIGNYMRHLSGFMHQDDIFVGSLTVWEHMNFMARFKIDRQKTKQEREEIISKLLRRLNLMKCVHNKIGGNGSSNVLSGGEKKRLAFATELLTDPSILFCDEPTTGLDSASAQNMMEIMNALTSNGKTILCTIHQPSSQFFFMFNQIILLSDGRIAYMGPISGALQFLSELGYECPENYNPADFFVRTLAITPGLEHESKQAVKHICNKYLVSNYAKQIDVVIQYEFHMGRTNEGKDYVLRADFKGIFWWTKLWTLIYRNILEILRNPSIQFIRIFQKVIVAFLVGSCYSGSLSLNQAGIITTQGAIVAMVCENVFSPMYGVLATFPNDLTLFTREHKSGLYSSGLFYLSKVIAFTPGFLIDPVIFTTICYWLIGFKTGAYEFWMTTLALTLTLNISAACGFFFSNAFDSVPKAMAYLVPFDYVLMITSGVFINIATLPKLVSWTRYVSWLLYSTETMSILQWNGVHNISCEIRDAGYPCITDGADVLKKYTFSEKHLGVDLWSMMLLWIVFHLLGFSCLWWKMKKKYGH